MRRRAAIGDDAMALQRKRHRLLGLSRLVEQAFHEVDCELIGPKTTLRNVAVPLAERRERSGHVDALGAPGVSVSAALKRGVHLIDVRPAARACAYWVRKIGGDHEASGFVRSVDLGQAEDLARVDQVRVAELVLVGAIDQGVSEAVAVACARNVSRDCRHARQPGVRCCP